MKAIVAALVAGLLFGIGIAISGMANPAKVVNFFDIAGSWDPSLIFVMGGALVVTAIGYRLLFGLTAKPVFAEKFNVPTNRTIDAKLLGGSAVFGIGWGISGFCPGGAIPAIGVSFGPTAIFLAAMLAGILAARTMMSKRLALAAS